MSISSKLHVKRQSSGAPTVDNTPWYRKRTSINVHGADEPRPYSLHTRHPWTRVDLRPTRWGDHGHLGCPRRPTRRSQGSCTLERTAQHSFYRWRQIHRLSSVFLVVYRRFRFGDSIGRHTFKSARRCILTLVCKNGTSKPRCDSRRASKGGSLGRITKDANSGDRTRLGRDKTCSGNGIARLDNRLRGTRAKLWNTSG